MQSGKSMKKGYEYFRCGWLRRLADLVGVLGTAHVEHEIESPQIEQLAAAPRQETSNLKMAQVGTKVTAARETFATAGRETVRSASQTITDMPELHNLSLQPGEAAERIQELEDELWDMKKCVKRNLNQLNLRFMQFNKDIQKNDKIIGELKKKLKVQKHERTEDGVENIATITKESLTGVDISQFDLLRVLGTGGFATVYLVRKKGGADDGRLYAMKVLEKSWIIQEDVTECAMTERRVLEAVRHHPFLITLHYAFQTDSKLYLVLDYMSGGDLATISNDRKFTEDEVKIYIGETILALEHLHKLGIVHRDVKLENILLDLDGHAVLSDFGLSRMFSPHEKNQTYSSCGTLCYMAPEMVETKAAGHGRAVDWWSLGIATYELLTGQLPFESQSEPDTDDDLAWEIVTAEPYIPDDLSSDTADFISKLLVKDPRKRLGGGKDDAEELKRHPFLKVINWSELAQKNTWPPFIPRKTNELDVSDFLDECTQTTTADLPVTLPPNCDEIFRGYSYISPSVRCSEHVESGEHFEPTAWSYRNPADL
jgi:serine/threonine protein kinase